MNPSQLLPEGV